MSWRNLRNFQDLTHYGSVRVRVCKKLRPLTKTANVWFLLEVG